jgi:hypothetical protein
VTIAGAGKAGTGAEEAGRGTFTRTRLLLAGAAHTAAGTAFAVAVTPTLFKAFVPTPGWHEITAGCESGMHY